MKKMLSAVLLVFALFTTGCFQNIESKYTEKKAIASIKAFYNEHEPQNTGELKLHQMEYIGDKMLVLAQKYSGDGQLILDLFLLDDSAKLIGRAGAEAPISPCFSISSVVYEDNTILFGGLNDTKWIPEKDTTEPVSIGEVRAYFEDGKRFSKKVIPNRPYIMVAKTVSKLDEFGVYSDEGSLVSDLNDIGKVYEQKFVILP